MIIDNQDSFTFNTEGRGKKKDDPMLVESEGADGVEKEDEEQGEH